MIIVDTNVLMRFIVNDDPAQSQAALQLFREQDIRILTTVMLECEWVLRSVYRFPAAMVCEALTAILRIGNVTVDDAPTVVEAISRHANGLDFADALHLAQTKRSETFLTFDARLARQASEAGAGATVVHLSSSTERSP